MRKLEGEEIALTKDEIQDIIDFISNSLEREWDHFTSRYLVEGVTLSEGMQRMDPAMYAYMQALEDLL